MRLIAVLLLLTFSSSICLNAEPVRLILDTDIGNDIDDTLALAMIHALANRGEVELLAVTITKQNDFCAPFVDLVNTFYGRPGIPIGMVRNGKTPEASPMIQIPVQQMDAAGNFLFPHRLRDSSQARDAVELLAETLIAQPDSSVTIAQIGFSTNLARLLRMENGRDLVRRKVKTLYLMAGNFAKPEREYNVYTDPDSFRNLIDQWPTPMIFSGFEIGSAVIYPYSSIAHDFGYVQHHPVPESYRIFLPDGKDRPAWDPTAVLESIRPGRNYFELSPLGRVHLDNKNVTTLQPDPQGNARYLKITPEQAARVVGVLTALVSEPPQLKSK